MLNVSLDGFAVAAAAVVAAAVAASAVLVAPAAAAFVVLAAAAAAAAAFRQLDARKLWRLRCPFPLVVAAAVIFEIFTA